VRSCARPWMVFESQPSAKTISSSKIAMNGAVVLFRH
jgi:hypothetical protein